MATKFVAAAAWVALLCANAGAVASDVRGALAFVPADTVVVVGLDVDAMRDSPLYTTARDELLLAVGAARDLRQLAVSTGFDVQRDVRAVVVAAPDAVADDPDALLLVIEASYDPKALVDYLRKSGARLDEESGPLGTWYSVERGAGAIGFFGDFIVAGPRAIFDRAVAARSASGTKAGDSPIAASLKQLGSTRGVFAALAAGPRIVSALAGGTALATAQRLSLSFDFDPSGRGSLHAIAGFATPAETDAARLEAQRRISEVGAAEGAPKIGLTDLMKRVRVATVGRVVSLRLQLSAKDMGTLTKLAGDALR